MATGPSQRALPAEAEAPGAMPKLLPVASWPSVYPAGGRSAPTSPPEKEPHRSFGSFLGLVDESKTDKSSNLNEKNEAISGIHGTSLPVSTFSYQILPCKKSSLKKKQISGHHNQSTVITSYPSDLETDCSAGGKNNLSEDKVATGGVLTGTFYKDPYKAVEQLATFNSSKNFRIAQFNPNNTKQGQIHTWNYVYKPGYNSVNRDFSKPTLEEPSSSIDVSVTTTNPLANSFTKRFHPVSYAGTQKPTLEKNGRNGDGDFFKKDNEAIASKAHPIVDNSSGDIRLTNKCNLKKRYSNVESRLFLEAKDASERTKALLKHLKNVNLNLKSEPIEHKDVSSSTVGNDTFPYPDFLPSPYNKLNLHKMALTKTDDWKALVNPPLKGPLDKIVSRLVEMERLQHQTIIRERATDGISPITPVNNRTFSSKESINPKHLRSSDFLCSQANFDQDTQTFRSCGKEKNAPKCTCQDCRNKNFVSTSPFCSRATYSNSKFTKPQVTVNSSKVAARRSFSYSGTSPKINLDVKMSSPQIDSPSTIVACSLLDSESSKYKQTRTKKRDLKKNGALTSKPTQFQNLKSFSLLSKQKSSQEDYHEL